MFFFVVVVVVFLETAVMRCYKKMSQDRLIPFCELPQRPVSDSSFPSSSSSGDSWVLLSYEKKSQHRFLSFCNLPKRPVSDRVVHRAKSPKLAQFHLRETMYSRFQTNCSGNCNITCTERCVYFLLDNP